MIEPADSKVRKKREASQPWNGAALYSADAEKAVLASMMTAPRTINTVTAALKDGDMFVPAHQDIFKAILELHNARAVPDLTTIHQYLVDRHLAEVVGSPGILAELWSGFATELNIVSYIKIVKDKSLLRALHQACSETIQDIAANSGEPEKVIDGAETKVFAVSKGMAVDTETDISVEVDRAQALIDRFIDRKGVLNGIPTGFHKLDEMTSGWQNGDMVVLAARPGVGKTALALTFAKNALHSRYEEGTDSWIQPGFTTGMFSLEMTNAQLMMRLIASYASANLQRIRRGDILPEERNHIRAISDGIKLLPFRMDDSSFLTINQLRGKARRWKERHGLEFLIIDYLQLLRSESEQSKDNRQNEVAEISRGVKALAKELGIPIVILAQLNRKAEEGQKKAGLHNLRESGAIEQDADIVMLLDREESDEPEQSASPIWKYSLNVAKQRNGPTGELELYFHAHYTRFEDPVRHEMPRETLPRTSQYSD